MTLRRSQARSDASRTRRSPAHARRAPWSTDRVGVARLHRVDALFTCADAHEATDAGDPDLAVADLAGLRAAGDRVDDAVDVTVVDDDLDLHLGQELDRVLRAAIGLGVTPLATEPLHLAHGDAGDAL